MVDCGSDVNILFKIGIMFFMEMILRRCFEIVEILLKVGVNLN